MKIKDFKKSPVKELDQQTADRLYSTQTIDPDSAVEFCYCGMSASTTHKNIMETIALLSREPKRLVILKAAQKNLAGAYIKIQNNSDFTNKEREEIAGDLITVVVLEFLLFGTPIGIVGVGEK